uniref:BAP29/BAP31 transmembrane domain-containing protein n=1 Tax=Pyramimonas obovata TaxID=1411642 RepID=A0A7S0RNU5_9CHLO|mmetsp:Transcript_39205/g.85284  ORF Transcript_39205/g.85284 Transcript_39205/m.85284 type:complete len:142 (+) Transcript_39205:131-556(+)|eukprot:CAMPEP_0118921402 /NCGR_PEP_ID=MMETSP1169-20130426/700_1 /TAXON_ID=36882 /ORGANISM="Pyramimonas obovata, Strain CCMP722" /LENGTH=141 /DNA_ID=CAMNT_0006862117 /DNA_START=131 /DNA_END=556 /DNA_ORIENTATION=+
MGGWGLVVHFMLPVPLFLCALVAAPLPRHMSEQACRLADKILSLHIADTPIVKILMGVSFVLFLGTLFDVMRPPNINNKGDANTEANSRAKRLRSERNFWIATFVASLWIMLYVVYKLRKKLIEVEKELELKKKELAAKSQ